MLLRKINRLSKIWKKNPKKDQNWTPRVTGLSSKMNVLPIDALFDCLHFYIHFNNHKRTNLFWFFFPKIILDYCTIGLMKIDKNLSRMLNSTYCGKNSKKICVGCSCHTIFSLTNPRNSPPNGARESNCTLSFFFEKKRPSHFVLILPIILLASSKVNLFLKICHWSCEISWKVDKRTRLGLNFTMTTINSKKLIRSRKF